MSKIVVSPGQGRDATTQLNANIQKIVDELNDKVLYRDNPVGEPNEMKNVLDMNGNSIYNLPLPALDHEPARLIDLLNREVGGEYRKTLRVEDIEVPAIPNASTRANKLLSFNAQGLPQVQFPSADSATQLRIDLASETGSGLIGWPGGGTLLDMSQFGFKDKGVWYRYGWNYESAGTVRSPETRHFMHDYRPLGVADGGTALFSTDGGNLFIGPGAGNLTMTPVALADLPPGTDYNLQCSHNQGFGIQSLGQLTIGYKNVGFGTNTLRKLTSGHGNTAVGRDAGHELLTANECTFVGFTAGQLVQTGSLNTSIGTASSYNNPDGQGNTALGRRALFSFTSGNYNIGIGELSAFGHTSGDYNTYLGKQAANAGILTGSSNTVIGSRISGIPNTSNQLVIANGAGTKFVQIAPTGGFASRVHVPTQEATAYDASALDGQVNSGATFFAENTANTATSFAQFVGRARTGQPLGRVVISGGATPFIALVSNGLEALRVNHLGQVRLGGAAGPLIINGAGSPAGVVSAPPGSMYLNTSGGAGSTFWIKESGTGSTGWVAK